MQWLVTSVFVVGVAALAAAAAAASVALDLWNLTRKHLHLVGIRRPSGREFPFPPPGRLGAFVQLARARKNGEKIQCPTVETRKTLSFASNGQ
jgi:hypothetical protein